MSLVFLALLTAALGAVPLLLVGRPIGAAILGVVSFMICWGLYYWLAPSTIWPVFGVYGLSTAVVWIAAGLIGVADDNPKAVWIFVLPTIYVILALGNWVVGWPMLNSTAYATMIGQIEDRDWTQDVQPKDPKHMRMVSYENALYIARKAVANAGTIGSQFQLERNYMALQRIGDRLMYAIPFDYAGFSRWLNSDGAPAYILVDAEDPELQPELVKIADGQHLRYTPNAWFGTNLTRHLRANGYTDQGFYEYRFEIDNERRPWWVVALYRPIAGWGGAKLTGILTVDPATGAITRHELTAVPEWIDRVFPGGLVYDYLKWRGLYAGGWINSWWGHKDLTEPEDPMLIYGAENNAEWVVGISSTNANDDSLISLVYVDSRTGTAINYHTDGGATDTAIMQAVNTNQQVQYKHLRATQPQIYNVYGQMAAVVPLLNDTNAYQGLALVLVENVQDVVVGTTQSEALRNFQAMIARQGQQIALEKSDAVASLTGLVDRIQPEVGSVNNVYMFTLQGVQRIFTASSSDHVKLVLTRPDDEVSVTYITSGESVVPVQEFDNLSLPLEATGQQQEVEQAARARHERDQSRRTAADLIKRLETMSPEDIQRLEKALSQ